MRSIRRHAEVTLDENWLHGGELTLETHRLERGIARELSGGIVESTTDFSSAGAEDLAGQLLSLEVLESHRDDILDRLTRLRPPPDLNVRIVLSHLVTDDEELLRSVTRLERSSTDGETFALITTPDQLEPDLDRLERALSDAPEAHLEPPRSLPTLWTHGAGGVLLHEAVGHPAGRAEALPWPEWLRVLDDPSLSSFETRIRGSAAPSRDLLVDRPATLRRASFRDHAIPRMSTLIASVSDPPFDLPELHLEITMANGGNWDPLRDEISLHVSVSHLVSDRGRVRIAPFLFSASRAAIAGALAGARGADSRYPGVLCSEYGQRLPVGTRSPDLLLGAI